MGTTHKRFVVRVADHEAADPSWRIRHAAETIAIVKAYFERDTNDSPTRAADGTFAVHSPISTSPTIDTLREMLVSHEGLTIVAEEDAPGNGIIIAR